jgi:hypothetical protein
MVKITLKQYVTAFPIEMYLENVTGMDGEREFISKFGLEIRDEATFLVSRRRFAATIPQLRPLEGDLIYIPLLQNLYEITQCRTRKRPGNVLYTWPWSWW